MKNETLEELQNLNLDLDSIQVLKFGIRTYSTYEGKQVVTLDLDFFNKGLDLITQEKDELFQQIETLKAAQ